MVDKLVRWLAGRRLGFMEWIGWVDVDVESDREVKRESTSTSTSTSTQAAVQAAEGIDHDQKTKLKTVLTTFSQLRMVGYLLDQNNRPLLETISQLLI